MTGALGPGPLSAGAALLDLVLPSSCAACGTSRRGVGGGGVCRSCWDRLPLLDSSSACLACALPTAGPLCRSCGAAAPPVRRTAAVVRYEGVARRLVHALKFRGHDILAARCGALMAAAARAQGMDGPPRVVVPVPSTPRRNRDRGYDPGALLAEAVARRLGLAVRALVSRCREAPPQSSVPAPDRRRNVDGAFAASARSRDLRVLLVDDVMTTGATAFEAARALRAAGASSVDFLVFARTPETGPFHHDPPEQT